MPGARAVTVALLALGAALVSTALNAAPMAAPSSPRILVFTKTTGFRHASIPVATRTVRDLAGQNGLAVVATEDSTAFSDANLRRYAAVVFLLTTGDVLNDSQQLAFQRYIRRGGGYVGVHSAADTEYGWAWYGGLVGAYFKSHPQIQGAVIDVTDARHPSTAGLPRRWSRTDEWYNFARNPRPSVRVLARIDESTYSPGPGAMGIDHPIAWSHRYQGGRAWYTAGGHTEESYGEPLFRRHLLEGIRYAAGLSPPRILSVNSTIRGGRLVVRLRYTSCLPCRGRLQIRLGTRTTRARVALAGGYGRATSSRLPRGRWRFSVTLEDPRTGLEHSVSRWARIR
jgi:cytochrome c